MPADNKIIPFAEGRNGRLVFAQAQVPKTFPWKTWSFKPNVTKHADGVNGEQRDRLSVTLNYYELTAQMYVKDAEWLNTYLDAMAALDAMTAPIDQEGAIRLYPNNATRASYILLDLLWDDWDWSQNDRNAKQMCNVNMRCTDIKRAKTL